MTTPVSTKPGWRFGVFEVDAQRGELRRAGTLLKLREQSFQILVALLENPGEIVTREDLRHRLWPSDTFVDFDHSLNTAVMKLRDALGDSTDAPIYIETIPKRGYRFIAPVTLSTDHTGSVTLAGDPAFSRVVELPAPAQLMPTPIPAPVGFLRSVRAISVIVCLLLVVAGSAVYVWVRHSRAVRKANEPSNFKIVPVSPPGIVGVAPAISPDGRMIAFIWAGPQRAPFELYVMLIGAQLPTRITYEGGRFGSPAWSPDGNEIAFHKCDLNKNRGSVSIVPTLGGPERRITNADCQFNFPSEIAWSSFNGGRLVFVDRCAAGGPFGLISFSLATGRRQCLTDVGPAGFEHHFAFSLSPDGARIAYIPSTDAPCDIEIMPLSGEASKQVFHDKHSCWGLMWTPDGQSIVYSSLRTTLPSLWRVPVAGGETRKEALYPAIGRFSADARRFIYREETITEPPSVWRADFAGPGGTVLANRKLIGTHTSDLDAQPSPDESQIVWMSQRTGNNEIWIGEANGESPRQLTHLESYAGTPRWSPDGKWIAFDFNRGSQQIFVVDSEGRNLHQVTSGDGVNVVPNWSRDGKWIYFASKRTGRMEVWKHSVESGKELQVTSNGGFDPFESFDGQTIYFSKFDEPGIWSIPSEGGVESTVIEGKPQTLYWGYWALTKTGIYFLNVYAEPRTRIEFYDFATKRSHPVLELDKIPAFAQPSLSATADGKTIFYALEDFQGVIKMMEFAR